MPLTVRITDRWAQFATELDGERDPDLRAHIAREYLAALVPHQAAARKLYAWSLIPLGDGPHGLRLAVVETHRMTSTASVYLLTGGFLLEAKYSGNAQAAEKYARAFNWARAECPPANQRGNGSLRS